MKCVDDFIVSCNDPIDVVHKQWLVYTVISIRSLKIYI